MTQIKRMGVKKPTIEQLLEKAKEQILETLKTRSTKNIVIPIEDLIEAPPKDYPIPEIHITGEAYTKMNALVQAYTKDEIAWHGVVEKAKDKNQYIIRDILVYPQVIAAATVDADEEEYPKWLMKQGTLINQIRMQGHSHVNMAVFPSGVDEQYYEEMAEQINDYYIFIIMNRREEFYVRFYDKVNDVVISKIPLLVWVRGQTLETFIKQSKEMIKDKYKPPVYTPPATPKYNYSSPKNMVVDEDDYYAKLQESQYAKKNGIKI